MNDLLMKVFTYRKARRFEDAKNVMKTLINKEPDHAVFQYQMAWCYDNLGLETEAVPHYEKAIQLGLPPKDLEGAYLGLGSTYRSIGRYVEAQNLFEEALLLFPDSEQIKVFYSMTLYNLKQYEKAMAVLLNTLVETTSDESILQYKEAIVFYSDKLNQTW
ncbi:tetratricopeptide repeat protein [Peribacillus sp. NPDC097198]|uniref:tetratricopeptide repeat protein n=1 Tax=Peribacillus sp. NPDC097198 TaxID=3364397 RepID=UPI00380C19F6